MCANELCVQTMVLVLNLDKIVTTKMQSDQDDDDATCW